MVTVATDKLNSMGTGAGGTDNITEEGHSMGPLLENHQSVLSATCFVSLILGFPLAINMLWHLQVSTGVSGRGVIRLIRLNQGINLLCVPLIVSEMLILAWPLQNLPSAVCAAFEWTVGFMRANHLLSGLSVALCRYYICVAHGLSGLTLILEAND